MRTHMPATCKKIQQIIAHIPWANKYMRTYIPVDSKKDSAPALKDLTHFENYTKYIFLNLKDKIYQGEWFRNILFFLINEVLMTFSKS